jgi:hypothetical protein
MEAQAGRPTKWEIEVGEDNTAAAAGGGDVLIAASSDQPVVTRLDTKESFQVAALLLWVFYTVFLGALVGWGLVGSSRHKVELTGCCFPRVALSLARYLVFLRGFQKP